MIIFTIIGLLSVFFTGVVLLYGVNEYFRIRKREKKYKKQNKNE